MVLGFVAGSRWGVGLRLGRGFYLWFMLACSEMCALAVAGLTRPHTHSFLCLPGHWGLGGRGGQRATGVRRCHRLLCVVLVLRIEKPPVGTGVAGVRTHNHTRGGVFVCGLLLLVSQVTAWL